MAHLIELRRVPTLYCSMMIAIHSLQKQCPHVSTAHYEGNGKKIQQYQFWINAKENSVVVHDKLHFYRNITLFL